MWSEAIDSDLRRLVRVLYSRARQKYGSLRFDRDDLLQELRIAAISAPAPRNNREAQDWSVCCAALTVRHFLCKELKELRSYRKPLPLLDSDKPIDFRDASDESITMRIFMDKARLKPKQEEVLRLLFWEGMTLQMAGEVMGVVFSVVQYHRDQALLKLRRFGGSRGD